jgi:hypothetical protein
VFPSTGPMAGRPRMQRSQSIASQSLWPQTSRAFGLAAGSWARQGQVTAQLQASSRRLGMPAPRTDVRMRLTQFVLGFSACRKVEGRCQADGVQGVQGLPSRSFGTPGWSIKAARRTLISLIDLPHLPFGTLGWLLRDWGINKQNPRSGVTPTTEWNFLIYKPRQEHRDDAGFKGGR